jgi:tetratricopeptide (TPR) repeat protein
MFCSKCGSQVNEGTAFCPKCGTPVQETAVSAPAAQIPGAQQAYQAPPQQTAQPAAPGAAKPKKRILPIVLIAVGAVVLVFAILIIIGISINKKADAHLAAAWAHIDKNELAQAIEEAGKVFEEGSGYIQKAQAYFVRAEAYRLCELYDLAIADYTKSLEIDTKHSASFNGRALCYYATGDYVHALEEVNKAISLDPNDANYQEGLRQIQQAMEGGNAAAMGEPVFLWNTVELPLNQVESEVKRIAARYRYYNMPATVSKTDFVRDNGNDWEWIYSIESPFASAMERDVPPYGKVSYVFLVDRSGIAQLSFHNTGGEAGAIDTRDTTALDDLMSAWYVP